MFFHVVIFTGEKLPEHAGIFLSTKSHPSQIHQGLLAKYGQFSQQSNIRAESNRSKNLHILQSEWFATANQSKPIRNRQILHLAKVSYRDQNMPRDSGRCIIVAHCSIAR